MMDIKTSIGGEGREYSWGVGGDLPPIGQWATIQADGHELQLLLLAMQRGYVGRGGKVEIQEAPDAEGA
jgi:hypothetical protein